MGASLNQELVSPRVQGIKRLGRVDVVHQHTAVSSTIEGYTERLESLLTGRVPKLHRHQSIVHYDFSSEEVGTDCSLVGRGESLVDI